MIRVILTLKALLLSAQGCALANVIWVKRRLDENSKTDLPQFQILGDRLQLQQVVLNLCLKQH